MILCCLPLVGCITRLFGGAGEPMVAGETASIPLSQLERIIYNFADRDVTLIADACEAIKRETASAEERRDAQHFKLHNGTGVYDIVTSPISLGHLVDLYVMIHLQHLFMIEEGNAVRLFGEKGAAHLCTPLHQLRDEINRLVDLSMKSKKKAQLDLMITDWRQRNPKVEYVSGIRFGNLPEISGKSLLEIIPSFFDVLNPLDDASRSVDETRHLAERAFYFSKRLPRLLDWQTDSALDNLLVKPDVHQAIQEVSQASGSFDRVSKVIERVPEILAAERKALLAAWDAHPEEPGSTLRQIRATLSEGKEFAAQVNGAGKSLELTFDALHRVVDPSRDGPPAEPSEPFKIADYTTAAREIAQMARDANSLVSDGHSLLISPVWTKRQEDMSHLAGEAVAHAERGSIRVVDHFAWRMVQVLIVFFSLLLLYRILVKLLTGERIAPSFAPRKVKVDNAPPAGIKPF